MYLPCRLYSIDKLKFVAGINNRDFVRQNIPTELTQKVIEFSLTILETEKQPRDNYREFLELVIIFLSGTKKCVLSSSRSFSPRLVDVKAIYALKIYLFKKTISFKC